jgi:guanylate kinase
MARTEKPLKLHLRGTPIVISAPSGGGKTTICAMLCKRYAKHIRYSVSATTRESRRSERNGRDYFFLTEREFKQWIEAEKFLEWAKVHGYYYGTPRAGFEEKLKKGFNVIMDIDVQGGLNIKRRYPESILIFLITRNATILKSRLKKRKTDTKATIEKRIRNAKKELTGGERYDYVVINDTLPRTVKMITSILLAEGCLAKRNKQTIRSFRKEL